MQFCTRHWEQLRQAIKDNGLWEFVSHSGQEVVGRMKKELEGQITVPDPLMTAHNMITGRAIEHGGLYLMTAKEDGSHYCPLCELDEHAPKPPDGKVPSDWWINSCAEHLKKDFIEKGWLKPN